MRPSARGAAVALTVAVCSGAGCSSEATPAPRAPDLTAVGSDPGAGASGDLLCGAVPQLAAERTTSGQRILDSDGEVLRHPDGAVGSARCEVYVSGQEAPAIRLVVNQAVAGGQDALLRASSGGADPLPEPEGLGYVVTAAPEPESEGGAPVSTAGGELLVENPTASADEPLRVLVEVKVTTTGRDQAEDVVALLGQVRRTLELTPLVDLPGATPSPTASAAAPEPR